MGLNLAPPHRSDSQARSQSSFRNRSTVTISWCSRVQTLRHKTVIPETLQRVPNRHKCHKTNPCLQIPQHIPKICRILPTRMFREKSRSSLKLGQNSFALNNFLFNHDFLSQSTLNMDKYCLQYFLSTFLL